MKEIITHRQFLQLVEKVSNVRHMIILWLHYLTARTHEISSLKTNQYDKHKKCIWIRRKKQSRQTALYLNEKVIKLIEQIVDNKKDYLFHEPLLPYTIRRIVSSYSKIVGLHLTGNLLRKSGMTYIARIANDAVASKLAGHKHLQTTHDFYIKTSDYKHYQNVLEKL